MENTFTKGNIAKSLIKFAIPLILASALQQLYVWVDALIVGNLLGEVYLSGVGATSAIDLVIVSLISGFVIGGTIVIAKLYGERKYGEFRTITTSFYLFMVGLFVIVGVVGYFIAEPLLKLLKTPSDIIQISTEYIQIIFLGAPLVAGYNVLTGALRGVGDSKIAMFVLLVSVALNGCLNPLFILVFNWGIKGVAGATVVSQGVSMLLVLVYIEVKHKDMGIRFKRQFIKLKPLISVIRKGLPLAVQMSVVAVGSVVLQGVMNTFGYDVVTGITTAYKVDFMILLIVVNTADSISVFVSQNLGAGNLKRANRGALVGCGIVVGSAVITTVIIVVLGATFLRWFGVSESIVEIGATFLVLNGSFYFVYGLYESGIAYLQGQGKVVMASVIALSSMAFRIVMSYALMDVVGWKIISYAEISCWVFGALVAGGVIAFSILRNKKKISTNDLIE